MSLHEGPYAKCEMRGVRGGITFKNILGTCCLDDMFSECAEDRDRKKALEFKVYISQVWFL